MKTNFNPSLSSMLNTSFHSQIGLKQNFQPISPHGDHNMWKMIKLYICAIKIYLNLLEFLAPIVFLSL